MARRRSWPTVVGLALGGFLFTVVPAGAQDLAELRALEARIEAVSRKMRPAVVLVRATGPGGSGYGSGAVVTPDGLVLTCAHVVDFATEIEVVLPDLRRFAANRLGMNTRQDYALLQLTGAKGLESLPLGSARDLALGDWVVAGGHPGGPYLDFQPSFTAGRVTGLHRRLPVQMVDRFYDDAIRTDAPIFAGNSGGPLVTLEGRLVGINGAILLLNEHSYAVPIDEVAAHWDELASGKSIAGRRPSGAALMPLEELKGKDLARFLTKIGRRALSKDGIGRSLRGADGEPTELSRMVERFGESLGDAETEALLQEFLASLGLGDGESSGDLGQAGAEARRLSEAVSGLFTGETPEDRLRAAGELLGLLLEGEDEAAEEGARGEAPGSARDDGADLEAWLLARPSAELRNLLENADRETLGKTLESLGPERARRVMARLSASDLARLRSGPRGAELGPLLDGLVGSGAPESSPPGSPSAPRGTEKPAALVPPGATPRQAEPPLATAPLPRAFLGIEPDLDSDASARVQGVLVKSVVPDGPAARGGVLRGDLLIEVDGIPLRRIEDLGECLTVRKPGGTVRLSVLRTDPATGLPMSLRAELTVTLGAREGR